MHKPLRYSDSSQQRGMQRHNTTSVLFITKVMRLLRIIKKQLSGTDLLQLKGMQVHNTTSVSCITTVRELHRVIKKR